MRKKINKRKNELPITTQNIIGILLSAIIGVLITVILTVIFSLFLTKSSVMSNVVNAYFVGSVIIGAFFTGFIASKKCTFKGMLSGFISSIVFSLIITIIMLFFSNGHIVAKTLLLYAGIILCSIIGGIFSANTKRRK